ncbi:hypothetical protein PFISCL1PPCAC_15096, partial [Pristionchus fissidentatus]
MVYCSSEIIYRSTTVVSSKEWILSVHNCSQSSLERSLIRINQGERLQLLVLFIALSLLDVDVSVGSSEGRSSTLRIIVEFASEHISTSDKTINSCFACLFSQTSSETRFLRRIIGSCCLC